MLARLSEMGLSRATLIGMSAVLMWSGTIALYRAITEIFGAVGGSALIFTVAAIIANCVAVRRKRKPIPVRYFCLGGLFFVAYEISLAFAVGFADGRGQALEVGMINYLWPSFTIGLAVALGYERASWLIIPGLLISLTGVVVVASGGEGVSLARTLANFAANPLAYGLAFVAALTWPAYTLVTRSLSQGADTLHVFLTLTAACIWFKYLVTDQPALVFDPKGAVLVVIFGVMTMLAYGAWNYGVLNGSLTLMSTASYFAPVLSVIVTSLAFQMLPPLMFWVGAGLVTLGSVICWRSTRLQGQKASLG